MEAKEVVASYFDALATGDLEKVLFSIYTGNQMMPARRQSFCWNEE